MDAAAGELPQLGERLVELLRCIREELVGRLGVVTQPRLREPQGKRQRHEPLLRAVVQVALEAHARVVGGLDDARSGRPQLRLLGLALGDVRAADDVLVDLGERPQPPGDDLPPARLADPGRLVLDADPRLDLLRARLPDLRDQLGRRDQIPELPPDHLRVAVAHQLAEGEVDRLRSDRPVALDRDEQAGRCAGDDIQEITLLLQLLVAG
jgi:hypothetical protein